MYKIAMLGTKHTAGGPPDRFEEFPDTLSGVLSKYLNGQNLHTYIYNGGQPSFSIATYPFKILSMHKEYRPDMFIIELPTFDKFDFELNNAITGAYKNKKQDYHPIYSLQRVQTQDWTVHNPEHSKYRISLNKTEALALWREKHGDVDLRQKFDHRSTGTLDSFFDEETGLDHPKRKLNVLREVLDDETYNAMLSYGYFYSTYIDESETDYINFMNHMLSIINMCKALEVKLLFWNMNRLSIKDSYLYNDYYKETFENPRLWVEDSDWVFKRFAKQQNIIRKQEYGSYFSKEAWQIFVDQILGKRVLNSALYGY